MSVLLSKPATFKHHSQLLLFFLNLNKAAYLVTFSEARVSLTDHVTATLGLSTFVLTSSTSNPNFNFSSNHFPSLSLLLLRLNRATVSLSKVSFKYLKQFLFLLASFLFKVSTYLQCTLKVSK